ncbi:hypothetical protein Desor_3612 [Desulfosporosinus orientis DSM 765]|uniref:Uncharacterized protein n=1 Tax=Desulfosporosinus orientis (strain ATCC 19365 / DSM 765 / NCIMB 8382 / VKM B-1628 / Singapore I) TaxID=768706 RepID=G7WIL8_DESOD|nr:DUF4153 domain-containing protein [Desulfosporosinus orientis]AET69092.1 hypothetical protein Desor_3612 [Desulfosporosinus orientis DSM 765]
MEEAILMPNDERKKTEVQKEDIILLISSVLLGVIFDFLFYKKSLGISYLIFVIAFYLFFGWNLRRKIGFSYSFGWFLGIPILALSSTYLIFANQIFRALNFVIIPILIVAQTLLIIGENKHQWFEASFVMDIGKGVRRTLGNISKPLVVGLSLLRIPKSRKKDNTFQKVLLGVAISIPLLTIIISLLTSADYLFKNLISELVNSLGTINLTDIPQQGILVLLISIFMFSYTWSLLKSKDQGQTQGEESVAQQRAGSWDPVISVTILSLINCVYVIFIVIQFTYMFGAFHNVLPAGYTYAEYARRGFFELLIVTLINFSLLLSSLKFTGKEGKGLTRAVQVLHSLLVLCTMVILVSAFLRMSFYEAAYGYTYLRVLTHSFMIFLFVLLAVACYKIWNERFSLLKPYILLALAAYLVLNFANIDVLIAQKNIARYLETGKLDTYYLRHLSYDSIPVLVGLLNEENTPPDLKQYLEEQQMRLSQEQAWQSFNISQYEAQKVLTQ